MKGKKLDAGKPRWSLVPMREMESVVRVLTMGANKYSDDNWQRLPNLRERYFSAGMRHLIAWFCGEKKDAESGESHLAHAVCCLLFLMWGDNQNGNRNR
jgi:hypothetical protein